MHSVSKPLMRSCFAFLFLAVTAAHGAIEQRCTDLGSACLCSEPLNTATYTAVPGAPFAWNPADTLSTEKECNLEGLGKGALFEGSASGTTDKFGTNAQAILGTLPAGHTNTHVLRGPDGHTGQWFLGHQFASGDPTVRSSLRFYVYFSNPYQQAADSTCLNSGKLTQMGPRGAITTNATGNGWGIYSWNASGTPADAWKATPVVNASSAQPDCCAIGPGDVSPTGPNRTLFNLNALQGKWVRVETVMHNRAGTPGWSIEMYMKNITDDGLEYQILNTAVACSTADCGAGTGWVAPDYTVNFKPSGPINDMWLDLFRNGTCTGYLAVSHIMVAAWATDLGQRIGAAAEIEGGMGDTLAPAAPTQLAVL
jgi:hypothetical protein